MVRKLDVAPQRVNPTGTLDMGAIDATMPRAHSVGNTSVAHNDDRMPRTQTRITIPEHQPVRNEAGFGGFPGPQDIVSRLLRRMFPRFYRDVRRTFTMPRTQTLIPRDSIDVASDPGLTTQAPYFSFKAIVGRNSVFVGLTEEQIEELGGVEYRALNTLMWVTPTVRI